MKRKQQQQQQEMLLLQNHGRTWKRGAMIGRGSFGTVSLATSMKPNTRQSYLPPIMAVKSAEISQSSELQKEREILSNIQGSPHVLRCFGDEFTTTENGQMIYNVLLEYGSGGPLAVQIRNSNTGLQEANIRCHTRSILRGLDHIHRDYVHCDIKPENILLMPDSSSSHCSLGCGGIGSDKFVVKIADFGLAKNVRQNKRRKVVPFIGGTPLYMSPESVVDNVQVSPADIWALGCVVAEMVNGKSVWDCLPDLDVDEFLSHIGYGGKLLEIPSEMSKVGKDFLKRCFVRNSMFRWTAEMLLLHPFVAVDGDEEIEESTEIITALDTDAMDSSSSSLEERSDLSSSLDDLDVLTEAGSSPVCSRSEGVDGMNAPQVVESSVPETIIGDQNRRITSSITATSVTSTDYHILKTSMQASSSTMQQHQYDMKSTKVCVPTVFIPAGV